MEEFSSRVAICTGFWDPTDEEWQRCLQFLNEAEVNRINRFKRPVGRGEYLVGKENPDAKNSLVGRLLIRFFCASTLHIPNTQLELERIPEGKPVLSSGQYQLLEYPNFDFNISHSGAWALGASESSRVVGVDVVTVELPSRYKTVEDYFKVMQDSFTLVEWKCIRSGATDHHKLMRYFYFWAMKEAYIKAIGLGLRFELQEVEFFVNESASFDEKVLQQEMGIRVHGKVAAGWRVYCHYLNEKHLAAVATGPPADACSTYKAQYAVDTNLQLIQDRASVVRETLFEVVTVRELIHRLEATMKS